MSGSDGTKTDRGSAVCGFFGLSWEREYMIQTE
ncbi:MAG: hypothetical protein ACI83P_000738, partial [Janthinobacterium sp.]